MVTLTNNHPYTPGDFDADITEDDWAEAMSDIHEAMNGPGLSQEEVTQLLKGVQGDQDIESDGDDQDWLSQKEVDRLLKGVDPWMDSAYPLKDEKEKRVKFDMSNQELFDAIESAIKHVASIHNSQALHPLLIEHIKSMLAIQRARAEKCNAE